jgi:hypothetical protein
MAKKWSIDSIKFPRNRPKNHAIIFAKNLGINEVADPELYYYVVKWYVETNTGDEYPISSSEYDEFEEDSLDGEFGKVHDKVLKEVEKYQKEENKKKKPTASKRPPKAPSKKPAASKSNNNKNTQPPTEDAPQPEGGNNRGKNQPEDKDEEIKDKIEELLGEIQRSGNRPQQRRTTARSARRFLDNSNQPTISTRRVTIGRAINQRSSAISSNNDITKILLKIQESVDKILVSLSKQQTITTKTIRTQKITEEQKKRQEAEKLLESSAKKTYAAFENVISPVKGILDRIFDFLFYTLLGKAFTELVKWISDPKNKEKIESLKRFFKDWWPAILGTFILFGTRFGKFIRSTVGLTINLAKYIRSIGIPGLLKLLKSFGVKSLAAGLLVAGGYGAYQLFKPKEETELEKLKPQKQEKPEQDIKIKPLILPPTAAFRNGGMTNFVSSQSNDMNYGSSGQIITGNSGVRVTGAEPDTQLIVARKKEVVLTPEDATKIKQNYKDKNGNALDVYQFVSGRRPEFVNNLQLTRKGGIVGAITPPPTKDKVTKEIAPKLSPADYNSLLAISALEDITPQGRSDVAQSIYNRLQAANKYGANFLQSKNTIRDLIIAPKQYQPTFSNLKDWMNIKDRKTAAIAIMNSPKGKDNNWNMPYALKELSNTERALKDPKLQANSQNFVGTRTDFYGTSEQKYMKPEKGDVLRNPTANFFVNSGNYGTTPAPIPMQFQAPPKPKPKPKGFIEKALDALKQFTGVKKSEVMLAPTSPGIKQPGPRIANQGGVQFTELPPITAGNSVKPTASPSSGTKIPDIPAASPVMKEERMIAMAAYNLDLG